MWKFLNPEIALGLLAATLFWITVLGWQASYAPTDSERHQCEESAHKSDHKTEECKSLWERTTTDPVAFFTFWLSISTVGLWIVTWRGSVSQARDMKESIAAAKESADIARTSLVSTQRAFVRVANFPWLWRPDVDRPDKYFYDITPIIENGGNTQTVDLRINVSSALRDEPLPEGFDFPFLTSAGFSLIGARQSVGASNAIILDDDLLAVQRGEKFFYIWGTITYRDVFPGTPERLTEFCTQISRVIGNPLDPREPSNPRGTTVEITFRIYPEHQRTT
jgi:hypothetical protein